MKKTIIICFLSFLFVAPYQASGLSLNLEQEEPALTQATDTLQSPATVTPPRESSDDGRFGNFTLAPSHFNTIEPSTILVELKPGTTYEDSVIVVNKNTNNISLHLYATDEITDENGSHAKSDRDTQYNIGKWTRFETSDITLGPNEKKEIRFFVFIPADANPSTYKGYLCAVMPVPPRDDGLATYSLRYATGIKITVTDNPKYIPKIGEINIFESGTPYFWGSTALFAAGIGYLIYGTLRDRKKKKQLTK
jgi:hypothetical protein